MPWLAIAGETPPFELICAFEGATTTDPAPNLSAPSPTARAAVEWIASVAGLSPNFEVFAGDHVPTVAFAAIQSGKRIIVYDAGGFRWTSYAVRWRDVVVMAHEIGHHLAGHTVTPAESPHARELEADRFAGYAVSLLGGGLEQALSVLPLFPQEDSETHPGREKRREALTRGWQHGERIKHGETP
ncbi:MAG: hypothetical protein WDO68_22215 [Gammaproteobacteria bacterium]